MDDPIQTIDEPQWEEAPPAPADHTPQPEWIGRYRIERLLGQGGFGLVFLAHDEQLSRPVAIKVPHAHLVAEAGHAEAYLTEARTVANLDHPNIVPVFDVGGTDLFPCYIVSKYIDGSNLKAKAKTSRLSLEECAELVATVADALHYGHKQGIVHRDIKPGNILLDKSGKPFVADFGLALREQDIGKGPRYAGTPAYMSPEQARGEGHRVDGRSDIFSLGVVFYELLTGRLPFRADSRDELLQQIVSVEVRPPRQIDDHIPKELERICLKALSKRASERYTTARDMADDLRHFLAGASADEKSAVTGRERSEVDSATAMPSPVPTPSSQQAVKIVPKGLKSFDAGDADFFLELLPGPRDREGLPESIRFWKTRIETANSDSTFSVGLIYGPSGCGKSSLVKAGLLPRLAKSVTAVYVEATVEETEARLLKGLRRQVADLPGDLGLVDSLAALRQARFLESGRKVLLVLDQFEQWLHAKRSEENTELVQALRQCDAGRVQCIVMVRDDFWLAVSRFMQALEIRVLEGENSRLVDLFDPRHARKVLTAFGRAFGALPEQDKGLTKDREAFLGQAVAALSEDGKLIPVRLALFAEMVKGKPWTPATLKEVGGTEGVGVTFLEETFAASTAPPPHRLHQKGARSVLKALVPEQGTDIKGHMRSHQELLEASGYGRRPSDFDDLLRLLDKQTRLVTPTDPEGVETANAPPGGAGGGQRYYQLTHDYLVPALRAWLTRKQKETRRGRAELRLTERAALWTAKPENRHLPAWWEWLTVRLFTLPKDWTPPQRQLMRKATRYHAVRAMVLASCFVLLGWGMFELLGSIGASRYMAQLPSAETANVPGIIRDMAIYRRWTDPWLGRLAANRTPSMLALEAHPLSKVKWKLDLHVSLALLPVDPSQVDYLYERLLNAEPHEVAVIRDALLPHKGELLGQLWRVVEQPQKGQESQRLRAAAALARYDPDSQQWDRVRESVANDLVTVPPANLERWMDALRPVRSQLWTPLTAIYRDHQRRETERSLATNILADYAADQPEFLADLLLDSDAKQFAVLFSKLKELSGRAMTVLDDELDKTLSSKWNDAPLDRPWKKPEPALIGKIEAAQGLLAERFACCQTMPVADFLAVANGLRPSGYRPTRFRPYAVSQAVQVAAVWTRDGQAWRMGQDLLAEEMRKQDSEYQKQGFLPIDVAGYLSGPTERYAGLWFQSPAQGSLAQMEIGLTENELRTKTAALSKQGYQSATYSLLAGADGKTLCAAIWTKTPSQAALGFAVSDLDESFTGIEPNYSGENYFGDLQVDVQVSKAGPIPSTKERSTQQLQEAEKELQAKPGDANARFRRAVAYVHLGENEKALADFSWCIGKFPRTEGAYRHRAILHARLGQAKEAKADLARFQEFSTDPSGKAYLDAAVSAYLREDAEGMKRLEGALAANAKQAGFLYDAARAYAMASQAVAGKEAAKAVRYAERAGALLKEAVTNGYSNYRHIQTDSDLDPIRQDQNFLSLLQAAKVARQYAAVWHPSLLFASTEVHGLDPAEHLVRCKQLLAQGYRPASISVAEIEPGEAVVASVWNRPLVPDGDREKLAKRQAAAAVALLRLRQGERVWPLLKHSPDPRVRSYLIHWLSPLGADPRAVTKRLEEEKEVSLRRALLLCLGEFAEKELPASEREALVPRLLSLYRDDPDPGIHGAVAWLLRQWQKGQKLHEMEHSWAKDQEQRGQRLVHIRQEMAKEPGPAKPQWYINGQGQTMVVIPGPVEFLMGSPRTEAGHVPHERLHRQRVGRTFALATTPVTVEQFLQFRGGYDYVRKWTPSLDCPVPATTWYMAAEYCNWLSQQEGLPEPEWCYEPNEEGRYAEGMKLAPDYLRRTGYRLPTEAEWEYACRAGAVTGRSYGETEELLAKYAWYLQNSGDRSWPVGARKPNDLGLFDMHGNVWTWCQEGYREGYMGNAALGQGGMPAEDKEDVTYTRDSDRRMSRGGSFVNSAVEVRSAYHIGPFPSSELPNVGIRPARTFR